MSLISLAVTKDTFWDWSRQFVSGCPEKNSRKLGPQIQHDEAKPDSFVPVWRLGLVVMVTVFWILPG